MRDISDYSMFHATAALPESYNFINAIITLDGRLKE